MLKRKGRRELDEPIQFFLGPDNKVVVFLSVSSLDVVVPRPEGVATGLRVAPANLIKG